MKALLIDRGANVVQVHNLRRLAELAEIIGELEDPSLLKLDFMSRFYLNARYKEDIKELSRGITEGVFQGFIQFSEEMIRWLRQKMR